jgi:hypothetical protein
VIAANWSGNADFVTADVGVPITYQLVPAHARVRDLRASRYGLGECQHPGRSERPANAA